MTSRDVRDIMGAPQAVAGPSTSLTVQPNRRAVTSGPPNPLQKRPDGITRELYALIGDNAPSLALAQAVKPKFKERLKRAGPTVKWQWVSFENPSRGVERPGDESGKEAEVRKKLRLKHWVRDLPADHVEGAPDHKFTKFNTTSQPYSYTAEEYVSQLREDDWPKDETDYLFQLAREYDLRFVVMADRWDYPSERTIDDLKARYYSVCRKLVRSRPMAGDEQARTRLLNELSFDKAREVERKAYLRSLLQRTPAQIAEEDFLYIESRRLEQNYNKISQERSELLKMLGGRDGIGSTGGLSVGGGGSAGASGGGSGASGVGGQKSGSAQVEKAGGTKKRNGPGWEIEGLNGGGLPEGWAGEGRKGKVSPEQDLKNCIERHPAPSISATKATLHPSVSLRSLRVTQPKTQILTKVQAAMTELAVSPVLVMPTKGNVEKLDALYAVLAQVVELKKQVDRIEHDIRVSKKRKEALVASASAVAAGGETGEAADVVVVKEEEGLEGKTAAQRNKRSASVASSAGGANKRARH